MPASFDRKEHLLRVGLNTRFKLKRIKANCLICNKEIEFIPSSPRKFCGYKCSNIYLSKQRKYPTQEKHHWWKGGFALLADFRLNNSRWSKIAEYIRQRDGNKCQGCNRSRQETNLFVHHLIPWRITQDDNEENLLTLCGSCHRIQEGVLNKVTNWVKELQWLSNHNFYASSF